MKISWNNFTGGEVHPNLSNRPDLAKYKTSLRHCENFLPELHGPLTARPGTYFLEDLGGPAVLLPFEFSSDPRQNYILVVQHGHIRIAQDNGFVRHANGVPVGLVTPYTTEQLFDISYAQSGDVIYLAHRGHPLHKVMRFGHLDWRLQQVSFSPSIDRPAHVTVGFSTSGSYALRYKVAAVNEKGEVSVASSGVQPHGKHPNDWVVGDYATITWAAVPGAVDYNIYREEAGNFGLVGVGDASCHFVDQKYIVDTANTPSEPRNPFSNGNHPSVVCFHQQRLILAAPAFEPQKWYGSRTGNYEDFSKSRPIKEDDSLEFTLASGRIDSIQWAAAFGDLLIGTAGSEYKAIGADQGTITPTSLNMREQSYWGSIKLRPLIIGNSVVHVQRQGSRVRDLSYSLERDGYAGNDLSVMASHLFDRYFIRQWCYQQSPGSLIWAVRNDGVLLGMAYMKEHDIWGWVRMTTQGAFRSVACTAGLNEDTVYCVAERSIGGHTRYYLERFMPRWSADQGIAQAFFVDSGLSYNNSNAPVQVLSGLGHLEGCTVDALANGSPVLGLTVHNGQIRLPFAASVVHVGLSYRSAACPQTPEAESPEGGSSMSRERGTGIATMRVFESVGGKYGPSLDCLYDNPFMPEQFGEAVQPFTGDIPFTPHNSFSAEGHMWLVQDLPLPFTLTALVADLDVQGM